MATAPRAVLFDFDGVIADSYPLHEACWRDVLGKHKLGLPDGAMARAMGLTAEQSAQLLIDECKASLSAHELAATKEKLFAKRAPKELKMMNGADNALVRMRTDFIVGITSLQRREVVTGALKSFGLAEVPETLVTLDDVTGADSIDVLLVAAAKQLRVPVGRCAMVDDARNALIAAKRVEMNTIAFDSNPKHDIDYSMADAVVTTLDEVVPELVNQVIVT